MKNTINRVIALTMVTLLVGCGGSDSPSTDRAASSDSKQLHRSDKAVASDYQPVVEELYVAYFGRPADPTGLTNFENALLNLNAPTDIQTLNADYATNTGIQSLINSFGTSTESQKLYGSGGTSAFVTAVFNNVLGRAPLSAGLTYWVNAISTPGGLSQGDAALSIMAGALANNSAQGILDGELINNRIIVAGDFTAQVTSQYAVSAYAGATAAASARTMLSAVTATTDTTAYETTVNSTVAALITSSATLEVFAGNVSNIGSANGTGSAALFYYACGVATDSAGNVYVADTNNSIIRKITPAGVVTTLAGTPGVVGNADGAGAAASFNYPNGIATDSSGNVYVADTYNSTIRKITPAGMVTTLAGAPGVFGSANGTGAAASFNYPVGLATDSQSNVYVADWSNNNIRKITSAGVVTTLAGTAGVTGSANGTGGAASFKGPFGLATDSAGNVYVADTNNSTIRKITPAGIVTTLAGTAGVNGSANGTGSAASFDYPEGVATDSAGNVYVADTSNSVIREITPAGVVTTLTGTVGVTGSTNGTGAAASFAAPIGVATDSAGNVYVADTNNSTIRKITPGGVVTTLAGVPNGVGSADGTGVAASFKDPTGIATDNAGNIYVADSLNDTIRIITSAGVVTTLAGEAGVAGVADGTTGVASRFRNPSGVAADIYGNVYVADRYNCAIRTISRFGAVSTLAGIAGLCGSANGTGTAARFLTPAGVATDVTGNVYVADTGNGTIRKVTPSGVVTTLAGTPSVVGSVDGTGAAASFNNPQGIATDSSGSVYVADSDNYTIRKITPVGVVTTLAGKAGVTGSANGTGAAARFGYVYGLATDSTGNVYVADYDNNAIRLITPAGVVTTLVGTQAAGFVAGLLPGGLSGPWGVAIGGVSLYGNSLYITTDQGVAVVNYLP